MILDKGNKSKPFTAIQQDSVINTQEILAKMMASGLKITKQRTSLVELLFKKGYRHVSAEAFHLEALQNNLNISLATVYNTLKYLYRLGLVNEIKICSVSFFDTQVSCHAHILNEETGKFQDINIDPYFIDYIKNVSNVNHLKGIDIILKKE
ncbi:putative helix-turn-helix domain-containing transcriptional regulator [Candidatus Hepatincolaceae symbiont of Richtersius coronifer]